MESQTNTLELSDQAIGAVMMALQWALMTEQDIVPTFQGFKLAIAADGKLMVLNPPVLEFPTPETTDEDVARILNDIEE